VGLTPRPAAVARFAKPDRRERDMEDQLKELQDKATTDQDEDIFETREIEIEEMAIDGICGVY
jgi:mycofactocin precursor